MRQMQAIRRKNIMIFLVLFGVILGIYDHSFASFTPYTSDDDSSSQYSKSHSFSSDSALSDGDDFDHLDLRDPEAIEIPARDRAVPCSISSTSAEQQDVLENDLHKLRMHRVRQVRYFASLQLEPQHLNAIETLLDHPSVAAHLNQFPVKSQRKDLKTRENVLDFYFRELATMPKSIEPICDFLVDKRLRMVYDEADDLIIVARTLCPLAEHLEVISDRLLSSSAVNMFGSSKSMLKLLTIFAVFPDRVPQMATFIARNDIAATYSNADEMCAWLDIVNALGCGYTLSAWDMYCHLRDVEINRLRLPDHAKRRIKGLRDKIVGMEGDRKGRPPAMI